MQQSLAKTLPFSGRPDSRPHPRSFSIRARHKKNDSIEQRESVGNIVFHGFALDTINQCLIRRQNGKEQPVCLSPRAYELLRYLVEHPNRLVTQEELLDALWSDTFVQPEVLKNHVLEIRRALGDDHKNPRYVETLPRRGYRFLPEIQESLGDAGRVQPSSPLIGRSGELNALMGWLRSSLRGARQIAFVTGESGIGKTALIDEFLRQAVATTLDLRVARGQCVEGYGGMEPYYPMLEALRGLCTGPGSSTVLESLAAQAPTWLAQLPSVLKPEKREILQREIQGATRERMLREIGDALEVMCTTRPILLIFEDMHWADPSTVDLISAVARRRSPANLMIVGTYRPADLSLHGHPLKMVKPDLQVRKLCREVSLPHLQYSDVLGYLATELAITCVPEGLADLMHRHSGGNPLFMVAGLEHLIDKKILERQGETWVLTRPVKEIEDVAPESLREMIQLRIEQLSPEHRRVLEIMSLKLKFPLAVVLGAQVSDIPPEEFERACQELVHRHQLIGEVGLRDYRTGPSPCYAFRHVLYKQVVYSRIPPARRKRLHLSLGSCGAGLHVQFADEAETEMAHQFEQGGDYARAIDYLTIASQTAARRCEIQQSLAILEHAVDLLRNIPHPDRVRIEMKVSQEVATVHSMLRNQASLEMNETNPSTGAA